MLKEVMNDLWLARISSLSYCIYNLSFIMDAVEDYARRWIQREVEQDPELESLSDWVRTIRSRVQGHSSDYLPEGMFKEVMNDLWLARISSLSNEVLFTRVVA
jgi:hypothetical protein